MCAQYIISKIRQDPTTLGLFEGQSVSQEKLLDGQFIFNENPTNRL